MCIISLRRLSAALLLLAPGAASSLLAQAGPSSTPTVFRRYRESVVKIQVTETGSGAKANIGSGFFVSGAGHAITNYHVISALVHDPERYRAEFVDASGIGKILTVLAIDVVHDLAVVRADMASPRHFALGEALPDHGARLYSLGHPSDLGLSIVEGTYNGRLQHTLYPKIHFTGSIIPGMSGGPTLTEDGQSWASTCRRRAIS